MEEARGLAVEHVRKRGLTVLPSSANMFMVDWKTKAPKAMRAAFRAQGVEIGRDWKAWPTMSRISVGSTAEMKAFCAALDKVWA
jgi:histidinol-phosphate aminotransferase